MLPACAKVRNAGSKEEVVHLVAGHRLQTWLSVPVSGHPAGGSSSHNGHCNTAIQCCTDLVFCCCFIGVSGSTGQVFYIGRL